MITQKITYLNLPDCIQLSNGDVEVVITTAVGPRIIKYAAANGENILGEHPEVAAATAHGTWKAYGGHRLWRAPENMPLSYAADNAPIEYTVDEKQNTARLTPPAESAAQLQKEITVKLAESGSEVEIHHKITNLSDAETEIAAWALTIVRSGGVIIIPNEPFAPYSPETLLPVRNLALWSYTDFTDPRWSFEKDAIRLQIDETRATQQKIGVTNKQNWVAYEYENLRFTKRFEFVEKAVYPDYNSNVEVYTAGAFAEIETLSPLTKLQKGESIEHIETWKLENI